MRQSNYFNFGTSYFVVALTFFFLGLGLNAQAGKLTEGLDALNLGNYSSAAQSFSEATGNEAGDAAFYLGRMLELGLGGNPDLSAAVGLYIAGSAKNSALAKNRLGVLHIQGNSVLQDFELGAKLICEAAELGDVNGAFNCGSLLLIGKGKPQDEVSALAWIKKAAEADHLGAQNQYAVALIEGKFVKRDLDLALKLFQQTASRGNPIGLYSLGQSFATGLGVDQDLVKAHAYFNIAAALKHPKAGESRALVEKEMTPDQIQAAQRMAKAWRPIQNEQSTAKE